MTGSAEYILANPDLDATNIKGWVIPRPVRGILKVPSAAVVPLAVFPLISLMVTVAPASGAPVATVPLTVGTGVVVPPEPPPEDPPVLVAPPPPPPQPASSAMNTANMNETENLENLLPRKKFNIYESQSLNTICKDTAIH